MSGGSRVSTAYTRPALSARKVGTADNQQEIIALLQKNHEEHLQAIKSENEELKTIIIQLRTEFDQIKKSQQTCKSYSEHPVVSARIEQLTKEVKNQIEENKLQTGYCNDFAKYIQLQQERNDESRNELTEYFQRMDEYMTEQIEQSNNQNKEIREHYEKNEEYIEIILDKIGESFGVIFFGIHLILKFCAHIVYVMTFYLSWKTDAKSKKQSETERQSIDFYKTQSASWDNFYKTNEAFTHDVNVLKHDLLHQKDFKTNFDLNQQAQTFSPLSTHNFFFVEEASAEYIPQT